MGLGLREEGAGLFEGGWTNDVGKGVVVGGCLGSGLWAGCPWRGCGRGVRGGVGGREGWRVRKREGEQERGGERETEY